MLKNYIFLLFLFLQPTLFAASQENRIAAIINNEVVTKFEIDQEIAPILKRLKSQYSADVFESKKDELWNIRLMQIIENKLLLQEAKRQKIMVSNKEVERSFNALLQRAGGSIAKLDAILRKQGLSIRKQRQEIREKMMIDKLLRQELEPAIYISPAHIQNYYYQHIDQYQTKQRVKVQNILIATEDRDDTEAKQLAEKVYNKIINGLSFTDAVKQYSEGQFKSNNGVIDFFEKDTYFPVFEKVCFSMKHKNEISRPFRSPIGWHIVKLLESKGGERTPVAKVASKIRMAIHQQEYRKKVEAYIKKLKLKSYIKFFNPGN